MHDDVGVDFSMGQRENECEGTRSPCSIGGARRDIRECLGLVHLKGKRPAVYSGPDVHECRFSQLSRLACQRERYS